MRRFLAALPLLLILGGYASAQVIPLPQNASAPGSGGTIANGGGGSYFFGNATHSAVAPAISGGGSLSTGSSGQFGNMTALAASSNVLTPGFTCSNCVVCAFEDNVTAGGIKQTACNATTITFSATASDSGNYVCGCR